MLSGAWDVVVVDCAPTAETLRLLALPEALGWYMQRVLPAERRIVKALKPVLQRAAGVPMPGDDVFDAIERLHAELDEVHALLSGPDASVRLVLTPETVVLAEARRSYTNLSLFGYRVDGVVANRVFPAGGDAWREGWVAAQDAVLGQVAQSFAGLPVWRSEYRAVEPVGVDALRTLATEVYAGSDPLAAPRGEGPFQVTRTDSGAVLSLALPFVTRLSGMTYLVVAMALGAVFLFYAVKIYVEYSDELARRTFRYSILYLTLIFAALLVDHYLQLLF